MHHANNPKNIHDCKPMILHSNMDRDFQISTSRIYNVTKACKVGYQIRINLSSCHMHMLQMHVMECSNQMRDTHLAM